MERVSGSNALQIQPAASLAPAPIFYRIDSTRVSWREYWWGARSPKVLLAWLFKLLRVRLPGTSDDPAVESLSPFAVSEAALPPELREQVMPVLAELRAEGFTSPSFLCIDDVLHRTETVMVTCAHAQAIGRVHLRRWRFIQPPKLTLFTEYISELSDGTFLWTLSSTPDTLAPRSCASEHHVGAAPSRLWKIHCARLAQARKRATPVPVSDAAALAERHHVAVRDFHRGRGFFRPLDEADHERSARDSEARDAAAAAGLGNAEVLAEIDAIERGRASWRGGLLTLLVSLALFLGAGAGERWAFTLALVPVLLFHELGHYVAMRAFHYRNLRMFFIPFFGAAVSGRHYNVAGWKKAVVSLMGPLPGVVAGGIIGVVGPLLGLTWARETALLLLVINGLNLLPVLPLDGGWVMHTLVFSRHPRLDGAFQLAAAAALAAAGIGLGDPPLALLAVLLLGGARAAYRLARIAHALRAEGLSAASPDDQTIPPAAADTIIERVKLAFPKSTARALAQHTLQVFATINARPPSLPAALGLGAIYAASLAVAVAMTAVVAIGPTAITAPVLRYVQPEWSLDAGGVRVVGRETFPADGGVTVLATFTRPAAARDAFVAVQAQLPPGAGAALFGQTLVLSSVDADAAARQWSAAATAGARDTLTASADTPVELNVSCTATDEGGAEALSTSLQDFFSLPAELRLIPPWASPDPRSPELRARHEQARTTYVRLENAGYEIYDDPRWKTLMRGAAQARKAGDKARAEALYADGRKLAHTAQVDGVASLRTSGDAGLDLGVVDAYAMLLGATPPEGQELDLTSLAPALGALSEGADGPAAQFASVGDAWSNGRRLAVEGVVFDDLFHGPAALVAWLRANGCADPHYEFAPASLDD